MKNGPAMAIDCPKHGIQWMHALECQECYAEAQKKVKKEGYMNDYDWYAEQAMKHADNSNNMPHQKGLIFAILALAEAINKGLPNE